jgi:peroxiredoxin
MKLSAKYLTLLLIFTVGTALIYFSASRYLAETPQEQIDITSETGQKNAMEIKNTDYPAPDFELQDISGSTVKLSDFKDKIVVLSFWVTWNPAAVDQVVILDSYFQEIGNKGNVVLLAVDNLENRSIVLNFIKRGGYNLPVLTDKDGKIGELYGINYLPKTFFINQAGKIKETFTGALSKEEIKNKVEALYSE